MNFKKFFTMFTVMFTISMTAFQHSKAVLKKVDKEIKNLYKEDYQLKAIEINEELNSKLVKKITKNQLQRIIINGKEIGFAFISKAQSKTDYFDYLIIVDTSLIIKKIKVLIYREDYGGEIKSKRWLKQFNNKSMSDTLIYTKDIIAISGATISANSVTNAVNTFLKNLAILHKLQIL